MRSHLIAVFIKLLSRTELCKQSGEVHRRPHLYASVVTQLVTQQRGGQTTAQPQIGLVSEASNLPLAPIT